MESPIPPPKDGQTSTEPAASPYPLQRLWARLINFGIADRVLRVASALFTALLLAGVLLVLSRFYASVSGSTPEEQVPAQSVLTPSAPAAVALAFQKEAQPQAEPLGIAPQVSLHTILPSRGRTELLTYIIQAGDTLFSIAEKFGLKPESLLWGNRYTLAKTHMVFPGQQLLILPVDGTLHRWSAGEGLNGVILRRDPPPAITWLIIPQSSERRGHR